MNKKKIVLGVFILIFPFFAFCYSGNMAGEKDLKIKRTEHFDIIYSENGKNCAALIVENCEKIYEELADLYELENDFRICVSISSEYQDNNAYFSPSPFNHIVLFFNKPSADFNIFTNIYLSTFKHELTHAVQYNLKNPFWYKLSNVFGDSYTAGLIGNTPFIYEGIAVRTESLNGEGRANDENNLYLIKQAKIEGCFPKYTEIQGALDIFPGLTASYIFGGYFWQWMAQNYGQKKITEFVKACNNLDSVSYSKNFKNTFDVSLSDEWEKFYAYIDVPEISKNPTENIFCETVINDKISKYSLLSSCKKGFIYYDSYQGGIFFANKINGQIKSKKIIPANSIFNLGISYDGRFLLTESYDYISIVPKTKLRVYDLENNKKVIFEDSGVSDSIIFAEDGKNYLVVNKFADEENTDSCFHTMVIYEIDERSKITKIKSIPLGFESNIYSLCSGDDGVAYFVYKNGLEDYICSLNHNGEIKVELDFNDIENKKRRINSVYEFDGKLIFSYADKNCLERFCIAEKYIDDVYTLKFQGEDLSGGIYSPVVFDDDIIYIGKFYHGNQLLRINLDDFQFEIKEKRIEDKKIIKNDENGRLEICGKEKVIPNLVFLEGAEKVRFGNLIKKGSIFPISLSSSVNYDEKSKIISENPLFCGITYVSAFPWTNPIYGISCGYNFYQNSVCTKAEIMSTSESSIFDYTLTAQVEADKKGFLETYETLNVNSKLYLEKLFYLKLNGDFNLFYGRANEGFDIIPGIKSSFGVGNVHSFNSGLYENTGFEFDINYIKTVDFENIGFYYKFVFPKILPFTDTENLMTYNLPLTLEAALFTNKKYFLQAAGTVVLFSSEIQYSAVRFPILYFNKFTISASYLGKFSDKTSEFTKSWAIIKYQDYFDCIKNDSLKYNDELSVNFILKLTPNFGGLANSTFGVSVSVSTLFKFLPAEGEKPFEVKFGTSLSL